MGDSKKSTVSVPKFDKVPWLSDGSLRNKPLLLSLPKRYPHASATLLISYKKDTNLPSLFQVPEDSFQVQQRTTKDPDDRTLSFEAFMSRRMKRFQPPKAQTAPKSPPDAMARGSVGHRLPAVGPRTAVFCGLLSHALGSLPRAPLSPAPRGTPTGKTGKTGKTASTAPPGVAEEEPPPPASPWHSPDSAPPSPKNESALPSQERLARSPATRASHASPEDEGPTSRRHRLVH
ncbi:uncharacterized protein C1orf105 homolog isoform 2-T2 [Glossophaga mutica]